MAWGGATRARPADRSGGEEQARSLAPGFTDISAGKHKRYEEYAIPADSFGRFVAFVIGQPEDLDINDVPYRPTSQTD